MEMLLTTLSGEQGTAAFLFVLDLIVVRRQETLLMILF